MTLNDFLEKLHTELELESVDSINEQTDLKSLDEWDSLTAMLLIGFIEEHFSKKTTGEDIQEFKNVKDIIDFIGPDKFN